MSIHKSKGLEFSRRVLADWERDSIWPIFEADYCWMKIWTLPARAAAGKRAAVSKLAVLAGEQTSKAGNAGEELRLLYVR